MAGASPFEFTVSALFRGRQPSPAGTWARCERARTVAESFLEANASAGNRDFLAISLVVSSRSSRCGSGLKLAELTVPAGEPFPSDAAINAAISAGSERLRTTGSLREQLSAEFGV